MLPPGQKKRSFSKRKEAFSNTSLIEQNRLTGQNWNEMSKVKQDNWNKRNKIPASPPGPAPGPVPLQTAPSPTQNPANWSSMSPRDKEHWLYRYPISL
jgi:hypothetical protein